MRSEVRQEKAKPEVNKPAPKREPTLPEIILKVLADNGHHFTQLSENESLTVVVTFRPPSQEIHLTGSVKYLNTLTGTTTAVSAAGSSTTTAPSTTAVSASSTLDYELLGDLHLKQGKGQEAITAYLKALEQKLEPKQSAKLHRKLAQAYLEEGKDAEAQRALQTLAELMVRYADATKQTSPKPAETPRSPLPAKLILSAPRRLLDQVGTGQLSFEAFQKAATVEHVNFPAGTK
jgi:tetratricopeptide (TPR) repeat protein